MAIATTNSYCDIIYASMYGDLPNFKKLYHSSNDDGTFPMTLTATYLTELTPPASNLTFEGWYLDSNFTTKIEAGITYNIIPVPGPVYSGNTYTIYGKWSSINKIIYKGETILDISAATVTPTDLDEGVIAWDANGFPIVGGRTTFQLSPDVNYSGAGFVPI